MSEPGLEVLFQKKWRITQHWWEHPPQKYLFIYLFWTPCPTQRKKMDPRGCMISHLIGCMEILFPKQNCLLPFFSWATRCVVPPPPLAFQKNTFWIPMATKHVRPTRKLLLNYACQDMQAEWMNEWQNYHQFFGIVLCVLAANVSTTYLVWPRFLFRSTCWLHWLSLSLSLPIYIYSSPVSLLNVLSGTRQKKQPQSLSMSLWN